MDRNIVNVPEIFRRSREFKIRDTELVSEDNVEESFYKFFHEQKESVNRKYLPIFWTDYYYRNGFGKNIGELQDYLDLLPKDEKYFTVCAYDDGIINAIDHLDIIVFSSQGFGITIPLLEYRVKRIRRECLSGLFHFRGSDTHIIRRKALQELEKHIHLTYSFDIIPVDRHLREQSGYMYSLCPRGYGPTTYRLFEAMSVGCIPVYISDRFVLPYTDELDWSKLIIQLPINDLGSIGYRIGQVNTKEMLDYINLVHDEYFTFEGVNNYIWRKIKNA